jgi:YbbR domain-containing protein
MNRIGLKIVCLLAAILIWIQVASTTVTEADLRMPIEVVNLPAGLVVSGAKIPQEAMVRVRAAKLRVIAHKYLHRPLGRVELDVANRQAGTPFLYEITPADVRTAQEVVAVLPPARLPLRLDQHDRRRVPIDVQVVGHLPGGKTLLARPVALPESVAVAGPPSPLREIRKIATAPVALEKLTATQTITVPLIAPGPDMRLDPSEVDVTITLADVAARVLADVPVTAVGVGGRDATVSPSVCDVTIEGPADSVRTLEASDVRVIVEATRIQRNEQKVRARIEYPEWVIRATVNPETFVLLAGDGRTE